MTETAKPSRALVPIWPARGYFGAPNEDTPTAYRYRFELERSGFINEQSELLPARVLDAVITELEPHCRPDMPEHLLACVTATLGCFRDNTLASPEILVRGFVEEMAGYPADVIEDTARELRRTSKFMPTIAEAVEIANRLLRGRRGALTAALAMRAEHGRRDVAVVNDTTPHGESILAAG